MERSTIFNGKIMENPYFNGHFQQLFVCSPEGKPSFKPMQSNVPIPDLDAQCQAPRK